MFEIIVARIVLADLDALFGILRDNLTIDVSATRPNLFANTNVVWHQNYSNDYQNLVDLCDC